jgi:hypothetical protein
MQAGRSWGGHGPVGHACEKNNKGIDLRGQATAFSVLLVCPWQSVDFILPKAHARFQHPTNWLFSTYATKESTESFTAVTGVHTCMQRN